MSDNETYQGLAAEQPGPAAPRAACSDPQCGNATEHPAERGWQRLMSAVPSEDTLHRLRPRASAMSYPSEADFRAAVAAARPDDAGAHSLERLRNAWTDDVSGRLADWPDQIRARLADLAGGWSGPDFEAFAAVCAQTRELVEDLVDDVDATVASLQVTEDALAAIQGGGAGAIPYPAPQFWIDGDWHSWASVHIRPAWWHGDCIRYTCQDAEHVLALGGGAPELATEIIDYIDERILHYVDVYANPAAIEREGLDPVEGLTVEEAKELAVADAAEHYGTLVDQSWGAYDARHAEIDADIERRSADTDAEARSVRTVHGDRDCPAAADPAYMDLDTPPLDQPSGLAAPRTAEGPSLEPPSGRPAVAEEAVPAADDAPVLAAPAVAVVAVAAAPEAGATPDAAPADDKASEPDADPVQDASLWGVVDEDDDPYA
ncbi:hypothetical protein GCM10009830_02400 [Glycomyces endophyticus]|uniref:WXG100 family type VII secretion target n=1 Tax=Glycomyces endophyticus TaxID=480996 RepID=A0ABN2FW83_9ACTN